MKSKAIVISILVVLFLVFLIQNTQVVSLRFLFWEVAMSRIIFMPLVLLIGFVAGYFVGRSTKRH